jgi:hypothetical protein
MIQETQETYRKSTKTFRHAIQVKLKHMLHTGNQGKLPLPSGNSWAFFPLVNLRN